MKKGKWTERDDTLIGQLQKKIGNKWSKIAESLPGRTDNDVKNRWHTLNRKLGNKSTSSVVSKLKPSKVPSAMPSKEVSALEPIHKPSKVHALPAMPSREVSVLEPILKTPRRGSISATHRTLLSIEEFDLSTEAASTLTKMKRVQFTPFNLNNHNSRGSFMLSRWTEDYLSAQMTPARTTYPNTNAISSASFISGVATATTPLFPLSNVSLCYSGPFLSNTPLHIRHTMSFQGGGGRMTATGFTPIRTTPIADRRPSMQGMYSSGMTPNICFTPLPFTKHISNSMTPFSMSSTMGFTPLPFTRINVGRQYNMNTTASRCISIGTIASTGSKSEGEDIEAMVGNSSGGLTSSVSMGHTADDVFAEEAIVLHAI